MRIDWDTTPVESDEVQCRFACVVPNDDGASTINYYGGNEFRVVNTPNYSYDFEPYVEGVYDGYFVVTVKYIPGMLVGWFINTTDQYIDGSMIASN